jgi:hypothetical protein
MILRINAAEVRDNHCLYLLFNDGTEKVADLSPILYGPIFEPLRDPNYFSRVQLDPVCRTVVWPNRADFAPEALLALSAEEEPSRRSRT